jgi:hypothetical protein
MTIHLQIWHDLTGIVDHEIKLILTLFCLTAIIASVLSHTINPAPEHNLLGTGLIMCDISVTLGYF